MSKTYEALKRASEERAQKKRSSRKPKSVTASATGTARKKISRKAASPAKKAPASKLGRLPRDLTLQSLLQGILCELGDPEPLKISTGGRVSGAQNPERARLLLERYALLHCVREGKKTWVWFWGNSKQAYEFAEEHRLPLDLDALV
ncbi:MAG: hypothetical protein QF492_08495 [Candidatus Krumholzibacteria bacterium]|nr:hypothetical protein [Candidatus Krumholzibacteria bacterium]MDP6669925.1 hypothetical protein [Candidatus Krumholzibacteria bacterium]MDP6797349.1 hypothetical protein [Candidatus Krumholzibacteria bacterium]MDP7020837.1 hypothetical protein [Candidatus Krumholzibacteria bacterium]